ncbi:flagellar basal body L-ring protein FlgH [Paralimibaculum aggregatum]|uniref:Flagellar L-ring protein n=1 Tax=Paralimibaculum aggregatum TaxID=3036245 RepID=A0ABQ6LR30_9RHOB|nr:flagellar basal body L-ring protein FlgH [Limibaculum sp. NKW23]GMG83639.1 flagellar basal body L-ring protein FlgH [Limibaculum sp. NKW23]
MSRRAGAVALSSLLLAAGCAGQLDHFGRPPSLTPAGAPEPSVPAPAPQRVALVPPPPPPPATAATASLWQSGPSSLFGDRRARRRGDIVTVVVQIDDEGEITNTTNRSRSGSEASSVSAFLGLPSVFDTILPNGASLSPGISTEGESASNGSGTVNREEEITFRLAATVEQVLPNGHLVIRGSQEVRINFELRDLQISGIVRPEDISRQNVITSDKIADARIVYGGRGQITDLQQPRIGQQAVDLVIPF